MVDNYPVVSQMKSLLQASSGDMKGARETQDNFLNATPVVGDATYFYKLAKGDSRGAKKTRSRVNSAWNSVANSVPLVGHVKSAVHYSLHETKEAKAALRSANRASAMTVAGFFGGPLAPVAVVAAGLGYDAIDSVIQGSGQGLIGTIEKAVEEPTVGNVIYALVSPPLILAPTTNPIKKAN